MERSGFEAGTPYCCEIGNDCSQIQVIPFGTHETDRGAFTLDEEGMREVIADFESRSNDLVVDYEHQSMGGGEAPAAGWIKKLFPVTPAIASASPRNDVFASDRRERGNLAPGVWAVVEWTPRAMRYMKEREYRYLSPVFLKRASDDRVVRLLSAALTNTPAIDGMVPLINKARGQGVKGSGVQGSSLEPCNQKRKEGRRMTKVLSTLGLTAGATEEEALKAIAALKLRSAASASTEVLKELGLGAGATVSEAVGAVLAMKQASVALESANEEMAALRAELSTKEGASLVAQAMSEGKITPAQKQWAEDYAQRDPEGFRVFVSRSPMIVPRGELHALKAQTSGAHRGGLQGSVNRLLMVSDEAFEKFNN